MEGKVEVTLKETVPESLCFLRCDTDYFESTYIELQVLYPLLIVNGILIIDDYGHFEGARRATEMFFDKTKYSILLNRIDSAGRAGIKVGP